MPQNARYTASASTFQFVGVFFISTPAIRFRGAISDHFNAALLAVRCYLSHLPNRQFITDFNQITTSIILILLTFLEIKYQGINDPIVMNVAVYSFAIHFFAYGAMLRFPLHRLTFLARHLLVSSGNITVTALSSVLLPDTAAPFIYAIFGLFSAAELLLWLQRKLVEDDAEIWIKIWRIHHFFTNLFGNLGYFNRQRMPRLQV